MEKRIVCREKNTSLASAISKELNVPHLISQVVVNRGIETVDDARKYIYPDFNLLHNPFLLNDMEKAVDEILDAIKNRRKITLYGDYDVDGVTATTALLDYFSKFYPIDFYIPDRNEGYGLNSDAIRELKNRNVDLIISVDCGITAIEQAKLVKELGMKIIITDHHEPSSVLPDAFAVIDPKRHDSTYPFSELAGCGVAYKLAVALQSRLKLKEFSMDCRELLDIVAFGTIADLVPLVNENRFIVKEGLRMLNDKANVRRGFKELITVTGLWDKEITAGHVGFYLAPRINALGRLQNVEDAVHMFFAETSDESMNIAQHLDTENKKRQEIENKMIKHVYEILPPPEEHTDKVIVLADASWHTGVKGIAASKILEKYYKPIVLCNVDDKGIASGSARSIDGFDIFEALTEINKHDIFLKFGGHEMAAGMSFELSKIDLFREKLNEYASQVLTEEDYVPKIKYDTIISGQDINIEIIERLNSLAPFGQGNVSPTFLIKDAKITSVNTIGEDGKHLKIQIIDSGTIVNGVAFHMGDLAYELSDENITVDIVCALDINEWRNQRKPQMEIKYIHLNKRKINPNKLLLEEMFTNYEHYLVPLNKPYLFEVDKLNKVLEIHTYDFRNKVYKNDYLSDLLKYKNIIFLSSPKKVVELAIELRSKNKEFIDGIGYCHYNLSDSEKEYIINLFNTGEITTLITTDDISNVNTHVDNIIFYDTPRSAYMLNKTCGMYKDLNPNIKAHLIYNSTDISEVHEELKCYGITKTFIEKLYQCLSVMTNKMTKEITFNLSDIVNIFLEKSNYKNVSVFTVYYGLQVFKEIGLVEYEVTEERVKTIHSLTLKKPEDKLELKNSSIYNNLTNRLLSYEAFKHSALFEEDANSLISLPF